MAWSWAAGFGAEVANSGRQGAKLSAALHELEDVLLAAFVGTTASGEVADGSILGQDLKRAVVAAAR